MHPKGLVPENFSTEVGALGRRGAKREPVELANGRQSTSLRSVLAIRDFRLLLVGTVLVSMTMPLQFISQMVSL